MKKGISFVAALLLCMCLLVGCSDAPVVDNGNDSSTSTTATRPTAAMKPAGELGAPFVGTWNVSAIKTKMTKLELSENGAAVMYADEGQQLSGWFEVTSDTEIVITFSTSITGTYVIDGDTITIETDGDDTWILTKAA